MRDEKKTALDRRDFLRKIGIIGTLGAGVALTPPLMTPVQADSESEEEKRKARYRVTDDVKAYYRVNRYPG